MAKGQTISFEDFKKELLLALEKDRENLINRINKIPQLPSGAISKSAVIAAIYNI